ncbi:MAG: hypothetical protein IPM91_04645 [Bacteroidetes bacterium]|nr:hypothetical protein [Bacteroidota bacterium]
MMQLVKFDNNNTIGLFQKGGGRDGEGIFHGFKVYGSFWDSEGCTLDLNITSILTMNGIDMSGGNSLRLIKEQ